jgi:hypothetical protein
VESAGPRVKLLLGLVFLVVCWPLGLALLVLYPAAWLVLLPFRVVGFTVEGVLRLVKEIFLLPARLIRGVGRR